MALIVKPTFFSCLYRVIFYLLMLETVQWLCGWALKRIFLDWLVSRRVPTNKDIRFPQWFAKIHLKCPVFCWGKKKKSFAGRACVFYLCSPKSPVLELGIARKVLFFCCRAYLFIFFLPDISLPRRSTFSFLLSALKIFPFDNALADCLHGPKRSQPGL